MNKVIPFAIVLISLSLTEALSTQRSGLKRLGIAKNIRKPSYAPLSIEIIRYVNYVSKATWKAGPTNRFKNVKQIKTFLGLRMNSKKYRLPDRSQVLDSVRLPPTFDARKAWPTCRTIGEIHDQGDCRSDWAFGAVEAMSDRICIFSNGTEQVELSTEDLMTCSGEDGCNGGIPSIAWSFWVTTGIVTNRCRPYVSSPHRNEITTPPCIKECQASYHRSYASDKHYGKNTYQVGSNQYTIMKEIFLRGPVEAEFAVYGDFPSYKKGVYRHVAGSLLGVLAVKMLGWGVEDGNPYWLMANSWNTKWGDKGYFKILRGVNECGIESEIVAGIPK